MDGLAQLDEQLVLQLLGFLVGREHLLFVLFELRRDIPFGILDGLFANVVVRDALLLGRRDLDVIAEDLVVADFQFGNAGAFDLPGLVLGNPLFSTGRQFAEVVQFGVKSGADDASLAHRQRAFVDQGRGQALAQVLARIQVRFQVAQQPAGRRGQQQLDGRHATQRPPDETQIARTGPTGRDTGQQPLDIVDPLQLVAQAGPPATFTHELLDRIQSRVDRGAVRQRRGDPVGQQAGAHGVRGPVDHGQQRAFAASVAERPGDFQAAASRFVDLQELAYSVGNQPVEVVEGRALRFQQVVQDGARGAHGGGVSGRESESFQAVGFKELGQAGLGRLMGKRPGGTTCDHAVARQVVRQRRCLFGQQAFTGTDPHQLVAQLANGKHGGEEPACGKVGPGQSRFRLALFRPGHTVGDGGQEVALARIEQCVVGQRARRDDAGDLAFHQALGQLRIFDLFADRGPITGGDDLAQVAVQLMMGESGHGNRILPFVATGQSQAQLARGGLRVLEEQFVEVPHPEQEQRIATRLLRVLVLLHHRRRGHERRGPYHG